MRQKGWEESFFASAVLSSCVAGVIANVATRSGRRLKAARADTQEPHPAAQKAKARICSQEACCMLPRGLPQSRHARVDSEVPIPLDRPHRHGKDSHPGGRDRRQVPWYAADSPRALPHEWHDQALLRGPCADLSYLRRILYCAPKPPTNRIDLCYALEPNGSSPTPSAYSLLTYHSKLCRRSLRSERSASSSRRGANEQLGYKNVDS